MQEGRKSALPKTHQDYCKCVSWAFLDKSKPWTSLDKCESWQSLDQKVWPIHKPHQTETNHKLSSLRLYRMNCPNLIMTSLKIMKRNLCQDVYDYQEIRLNEEKSS